MGNIAKYFTKTGGKVAKTTGCNTNAPQSMLIRNGRSQHGTAWCRVDKAKVQIRPSPLRTGQLFAFTNKQCSQQCQSTSSCLCDKKVQNPQQAQNLYITTSVYKAEVVNCCVIYCSHTDKCSTVPLSADNIISQCLIMWYLTVADHY